MRRFSVNYEGDLIPSPHGDLVEYRDVLALEEEVERLRKLLASPKPDAGASRLFGWANPDDARSFLSGDKNSCRLYRKRSDMFCMPVSNTLGPNHYQKPPRGTMVTIEGGVTVKVVSWTEKGLIVRDAFDHREEVDKWTWKR